jgi:hypothetical protein
MTDQTCPLPGFKHRDLFMQEMDRRPATGRRWQGKGLIVVRYFGKEPYVDLDATAARARGEDRPKRRQRAQTKSEPVA